ncbi:FtsX-like permease family protein [Agromyces mediolanus]|uniref:Membrane protein n=1 Tax=Agromyces mediolanus TaxID=41986 RepID=A0A918CCR7_AGRME|nr:FtsX-like permease family protein [Agromyces mediolanus]GGR15845.1 membrane protein [Agromyces mediolanus]GLJ73554.1 membrane protein [Agromyces mediolanus]
MSRHSRLSSAGLVGRQFQASPTASVLLAVLVAVAAFAAVALPRAITALHTESLQQSMAAVEPRELDLTASTRDRPPVGPGESALPEDVAAVWGSQAEQAEQIRERLPDELRAVLGPPSAVVVGDPVIASTAEQGVGSTVFRIQPGFDPRLREHAELSEGEWPVPFDGAVPGAEPIEIVLSVPVAERLEWAVGETRTLDFPTGQVPAIVTGTYTAVDPADPFWSHVPTALRANREQVGLSPPIITGVGMLDPSSWETVQSVSLPIQLQVWFPLEPGAVRAEQMSTLIDQLGEVESRMEPLDQSAETLSFRTAESITFRSGLRDVLIQARSEAVAVDAVLATVASGPIGVTVAVLVLGALVVFERRRTGLELAAARGGSTGQLRAVLGAEGAIIGLPALLAGGVAGTLAVSSDAGSGGWWLAAAFALAPGVLLAASAGQLSPLRRARVDLGGVPARGRWIAELAVVLVAATAVVLLFRRGLAGTDPAGPASVDPLLAAVPLLLALVVCVVVLRLYPIPLRRLVTALERRRSLVAFLGAARALRDPSAGLVPVLAVVVGVAVAVFSAVLLGTVRGGIEASAAVQVGADVQLHSGPLTTAQLDELRALDGVEAIAPVYSTDSAPLEVDGQRRPTTVVVVDVAEMTAVQEGRSGVVPLPAELGAGDAADRPVAVLASGALAERLAGSDRVRLDGQEIDVVEGVTAETAFTPRRDWLLVDRSKARPFTDTLVPRTVLIRVAPDASARAVADAAVEIAGDGATADTPDSLAAALAASPAARGLMVALAIAIVLTSLATALAIVLTLVVGRPARERLLPLLSTLGLRRREERALVAWEIGPVVVAAVVAGAALGLLLPAVVLPAINIAAFTGAIVQPPISIDPLLVGGVLTGAIAVSAIGAWVAASIGGRVDAARALRKEEES